MTLRKVMGRMTGARRFLSLILMIMPIAVFMQMPLGKLRIASERMTLSYHFGEAE
jgi:hypothetical protein